MEHSLKPNGLRVKSWGDIAAIVAVLSPTLAMLLATVMWGLKLEGELNIEREHNRVLDNRVVHIEQSIRAGQLQVARVRLDSLEKRVDRIEQNHGSDSH